MKSEVSWKERKEYYKKKKEKKSIILYFWYFIFLRKVKIVKRSINVAFSSSFILFCYFLFEWLQG